MISKYPILLWLGAGGLLGASFLSSFGFVFAIVGFVLLLHASSRNFLLKERITGGFITGIFLYVGALRWYWYSFPLPGIGEQLVFEQLFIIGLYTLFSCLLLCSGVVVFVLVTQKLLQKPVLAVVLVPLAWLLCEQLSMLVYSLGTYGEGGKVGFNYGFGLLGAVFSHVPFLLPAASFFGMYGLSFVAALLCTGSYFLFLGLNQNSVFFKKVGVGTLVVICSVVALANSRQAEYVPLNMTVVVVETYFDKTFFSHEHSSIEKGEILKTAVAKALQLNKNSVLLPEDSRFLSLFSSEEALFDWIETVAPTFAGTLIDSGRMEVQGSTVVLRGYVFDTVNQTSFYTDKEFLVPQGEFLSLGFTSLLSLVFSEEVFSKVGDRFAYRIGVVGTIPQATANVPNFIFCSESVVPYAMHKRLRLHKSDFVAHPISHAWFTEPTVLLAQLDAMLQIQAIWNKTPIVSAANMAESKLYLPTGEIRSGEVLFEGDRYTIKHFDL